MSDKKGNDIKMNNVTEDTALMLSDIGMRFNLSKEKVDSVKEYFIKLVKHELKFDEFWALRNISFEVKKGERVGVLGRFLFMFYSGAEAANTSRSSSSRV